MARFKEAVETYNEALLIVSNDIDLPIYITGDFNNANTQVIQNAFDLDQINNKPTNRNQDKCLDIILTNSPKCYHCINLQPIGKSDHDIVVAYPNSRRYKKTRPPLVKIQVRHQLNYKLCVYFTNYIVYAFVQIFSIHSYCNIKN